MTQTSITIQVAFEGTDLDLEVGYSSSYGGDFYEPAYGPDFYVVSCCYASTSVPVPRSIREWADDYVISVRGRDRVLDAIGNLDG